MLYNQPYGITDPDAPYINGNPSTGTMGSIPPAASIEHPQREIVNFIKDSGLTPVAADLHQLGRSVQSGRVTYALDQGTPNNIVLSPSLAVSTYTVGLRFVVKVGNGNTSQVKVNISGVGFAPLVHTDLTPMNPWELTVGQLIEIAYDGSQFQAIAGVQSGGAAVVLTAPHTIYIDATIGSDTAYDGTSPTISGAIGGPFLTMGKALSTMRKYNLGGWNFTIKAAAGTYITTETTDFPIPNGSGTVTVLGDESNPDAYAFYNAGTGTTWMMVSGGHYIVGGFKLRCAAPKPGDGGCCLWAGGATFLQLATITWDSAPGVHLNLGAGGQCLVAGNQKITGNAWIHQAVGNGGSLICNNPAQPTMTIANPVNIGSFVVAQQSGSASPVFASITGAGNVTGQKFQAYGNGTIDSRGNGVNYLPGSSAGSTATGGQYL